MLYKFKSKATADLVMLQPNAEELLKIIGKAAGPTGIITVAQASAAIAAIQAEIQRREALREAPPPSTDDDANDAAKEEAVSLRHRAAPFLDMLRQSSAEGKDVVWGV
ncbi:MAG: DUF1840 domain-containing protein [Burkholderiaceae bacterium]|jgi:cyclopropane-fatty-acyl-phospholipid synthase|nr:DUF1840 domain-containing protein [Pseudomonadota bacterium]MBS0597707.1 DUF1840 domain-containing protein [Pseudomonadota bacterium]MCO5114944.1 DUF1840 domain-containing protein [Burkholderiaceae bacterium]MCP5217632.1 DUF1840 domain-containing protein [Burkholderiaceae bacterium]